MTDPIVFPDAVALVVDYLIEQFALIGDLTPITGPVPKVRPDKFVTVQRTGGPRHTLVTDGAQLTVETWAQNDQDAHDLAQRVRAYIHTLPGVVQDGVAMYGVIEFSGPAALADPVSGQARYTQTFQVGTRGYAMTPTGS